MFENAGHKHVYIRAGSRLPCVGGSQPGEGLRGPPRPLVGPGQSPGRGVQGAKPPTENDFQCFKMARKALPCTIL